MQDRTQPARSAATELSQSYVRRVKHGSRTLGSWGPGERTEIERIRSARAHRSRPVSLRSHAWREGRCTPAALLAGPRKRLGHHMQHRRWRQTPPDQPTSTGPTGGSAPLSCEIADGAHCPTAGRRPRPMTSPTSTLLIRQRRTTTNWKHKHAECGPMFPGRSATRRACTWSPTRMRATPRWTQSPEGPRPRLRRDHAGR